MSVPPTPGTPLRRLSRGSLAGLSRSAQYQDAPDALGFLEPLMPELADESDALMSNIEALQDLNGCLATFNESFGSFLYMMKMNACCVEWIQAPTDNSFALARQRAFEAMKHAREAQEAAEAAAAASRTADTTVMPSQDNEAAISRAETPGKDGSGIPKPILKKRPTIGGKQPKLTGKEKRTRDRAIEEAVNQLPLEFRSADVDLRRIVDKLIIALMEAPEPLPLVAFVKPPELTHAKVNKCFISFVGSKLVTKNVGPTKQALYGWKGPAR